MPITDTFTGTAGENLTTYSAGWVYANSAGGALTLQSNGAGCNGTTLADAACQRAESRGFAIDHYAQVTMALAGTTAGGGVLIRAQGAGTASYYTFLGGGPGAVLYEVLSNSGVQMGSVGSGFTTNDVARCHITAEGLLTPTVNGSLRNPPGQITDTSFSGGTPGIVVNSNGGAAGNAIIDNFECSDPNSIASEKRAIPAFVAAGTFSGLTTAPTPGMPTFAPGDFLLLLIETANEAIATPSGWTQHPNSPQSTGTAAAAGGVRLGVFYRVAQSGDAAPTIADAGNHTCAQIFSFRGVDSVNPFNVSAGTVQAATTAVVFSNITTTVECCLVVNCMANDRDIAGTANLSAHANPMLESLTERADQTIADGVGGGLGMFTGLKRWPGPTGSTRCTNAASVTNATITLALQGAPIKPPFTPAAANTSLRR